MCHLKDFQKMNGLGGCNKSKTNSQMHPEITYIKLEEQIPLLGGNLIICTKGQVMDFRALSKIHPLKQNQTQMLVKRLFGLKDQTALQFNSVFLIFYQLEDVFILAPMYLQFQRGCHGDSSLEGDFCRHVHL